MTPLLSTRHSWRLHFGETPPPPILPRTIDAVRVSMGLGMAALDTMIDSGYQVGPLLCCLTHRMLLIPVRPGTADLWAASHSSSSNGPALQSITQGYQSPCRNRLWITAPEPLTAPTTAPAALHDSLSLMRARIRRKCGPLGPRGREVCHV
ncbi:hypothetical protein [Streptomyces sp. NPDC001165]|uniref:hypothetical protein n=1 Tax=Streptomyces sp. NPDC001165 TaxID=3364546 RepID=UPI003676B111